MKFIKKIIHKVFGVYWIQWTRKSIFDRFCSHICKFYRSFNSNSNLWRKIELLKRKRALSRKMINWIIFNKIFQSWWFLLIFCWQDFNIFHPWITCMGKNDIKAVLFNILQYILHKSNEKSNARILLNKLIPICSWHIRIQMQIIPRACYKTLQIIMRMSWQNVIRFQLQCSVLWKNDGTTLNILKGNHCENFLTLYKII